MVLPFLGASIATGIGTLAGLSLGPYVYSTFIKTTSYRLLHEKVDNDHTVPTPNAGLLVKTVYRDALPLLEPWVTDPAYDRVSMINRLTATVWPTLTKAILDLVIQGDLYNSTLYPQLKAQVFDKYPFVEDIFLGPNSLRHGKADTRHNPFLEGKLFTLGNVAPRLGGMRVVSTADDEVLLETSLIWGSEATFDVHVVLRFGRLRLLVPLQLANISFKADVRVVLRPLVEKFPCLGGMSISLLRVPVVDFSLKLLKGVDIMALPLLPQLVQAVLKVVLEPVTLPLINKPLIPGLGLVLPNAVSIPIMPKFGLPDPPVGAFKVTLFHLDKVKGGEHMYCRLEIRPGRFKQTRTVTHPGSPIFNEEFALIVDSLENDRLRICVYEDDVGWNDTLLGDVVLPFGEVVGTKIDPVTGKELTDFQRADFITMENGKNLTLQLRKVHKKGQLKSASSRQSFAATKPSALTSTGSAITTASSISRNSIATLSRIFSRKKSKKVTEAAAVALAGTLSSAGASDAEGGAASSGVGGGSRSIVLPSSTAVLPGEGKDKGKPDKDIIGSISFKVEFIRFNKPEYDDVNEEEVLKSKTRDPYLSIFPPPLGRTVALLDGSGGTSSKLSYGVLTVHLIRCIDLAPEGAKDLATYVRMIVTNDEKDEVQTSSTILNETSPRWGDKFDFVLIPCASELHLHVHNKPGVLGNLMGSLLRRKTEDKDPILGKVLIPVDAVARNGRIREVWSLEDAERGYIEISLTWQTCHLSRDQQRGGR